MRIATSTLFAALLLGAWNPNVLAGNMTDAIKDRVALSDAVHRVFSKPACMQVSENEKRGDDASMLASTFRFRCQGDAAAVALLLKELQEVGGLKLDGIVTYSGVDPERDGPSVDVRFDVVALAGHRD